VGAVSVVVGSAYWQASGCIPGAPGCRETVARKPIFEGFGVNEALIIGGTLLATLAGLVIVTYLLAVATGATRDFDDERPAARLGPQPWLDIRSSTWVCVAAVLALATGTGAWIALGSEPDRSIQGSEQAAPASTSAQPTSTVAQCPPPKLTANFLPTGFTNKLNAGAGHSFITDASCYFHYKGANNSAITVISSGVSPFGPPGVSQVREQIAGRTLWVGSTPQGALGVLIEESELGGANDIWYTLVSNTVTRADLLQVAAGLQRCERC